MTWHKNIKIGDILTVDQVWNETSPKHCQLNERTEVLGVIKDKICDTGIMLKVKYKSSGTVWLSAGWFIQPEEQI